MVTDLSFTPKSINDINDDFLKNMKAKYIDEDNENKNPSSKNLSFNSTQKNRTDKKVLTPFDEVRPVVVIDEKNNAKFTKLANLKRENQELKPTNKDVLKVPKPEDKKETKIQKTQLENKEISKQSDKKLTVIEKPIKHTEVSSKSQNKVISNTKTTVQELKQPAKKEQVQKKINTYTEPAKDKETTKVQTAPKNESLKEKTITNTSAAKEHKGDMYNDYFEEFLGILSTPEKKGNKKPDKKNAQVKSLLGEFDEGKENKKISSSNDKSNEKKSIDNSNKSEQNVYYERNYDKCFLSNSRALIAKAKRLRHLFLSGCTLLVCSILLIAILFTMSRFIPAKEIVEQSKKNEEIVEVNDEGNPQYSNETRIECLFVESYSFSAFINTYYLHWVIVLSLILLGASIVFFSLYVRERGAGSILKFIKSKKRKE